MKRIRRVSVFIVLAMFLMTMGATAISADNQWSGGTGGGSSYVYLTTSSDTVGIGTATPQEKLTLGPSSNFAVELPDPVVTGNPINIGTGSLSSGRYDFTICSLDGVSPTTGETIGYSVTVEIFAIQAPADIRLTWSAVPGAYGGFRVYYVSGSIVYWDTPLYQFDYTGQAGTAGTLPTVTTAYVNKITYNDDSWFLGGYVGIGTPNPAGILHVDGGTAKATVSGTDISLTAEDGGTGNTNGGSIVLTPGAKGSGTGVNGIVHVVGNLGVSGWISQDGDDEGILIDNAGNVGIGISSPEGILTIDNTGEPKGLGVTFDNYHVQTTTATITTIATITTTNDYAYGLTVTVVGIKSDGSEVAHYVRHGTFKNDGGTLTELGSESSVHTQKDDANWDVSISASGTNILVRVTGNTGDTVEWQATIEKNMVTA